MKRILEIISVFFIALSLTLGAAGVSLHKMSCLESGKVSVSIEKLICCPDDFLPVTETTLSATCCEFDQSDFKIHSFESKLRVFQWIAPLVVHHVITTPPSFISERNNNILFEVPPLPPAERLALLCSYLI
jgi:hypothetical protein